MKHTIIAATAALVLAGPALAQSTTTVTTTQAPRAGAAVTIAPEQLSARLKSVLLSEPTPALHAFGELVDETLDLVDVHMPQVDTKPVREELSYQQEAWTLHRHQPTL